MIPEGDHEGEYRVRLDIFDGPLDLLLHLCRRQEVDVRDISISLVTEQYLQYLDLLEQLNLEVAGAYLAMAAMLCHIKSQVLLPRPTLEGDEDEGPDPRLDLIQQLLEYERYREAADQLTTRPILDRDTFDAEPQVEQDEASERPVEGNLFMLLDALRELLGRRGAPPLEHRVSVTRFTIGGRMREVVRVMRRRPRVCFLDLFADAPDREEILVTFLALLEMVRMRYVSIEQGGHLEPIELRLNYVGSPEDLPVPGEVALV